MLHIQYEVINLMIMHGRMTSKIRIFKYTFAFNSFHYHQCKKIDCENIIELKYISMQI